MRRLFQSWFGADDGQLMWRVKTKDDEAAFGQLVARWEKPIQRLCVRMTGDTHRAEDLTQMAFARVFARRAEWEPAARFSTFLWRVTLNLCHDELRRLRRRGESSLDALEEIDSSDLEHLAETAPSPIEQADSSERGELVRDALARLPAHYREVVVLRHYEGLKFREIGELLDIPEGTAKSRMAEALTQLSRSLNHLKKDQSCNTNPLQPARAR